MKKIDFKNKKVIIISAIVFVVSIMAILLMDNKKLNIFEEKVNIKPSDAGKIKLVDYDHANFKMKIPAGWKVETAGENMYFSIRIYDPNDDRYQIYSILKAEPFLKNEKAKAWYENYYKSFGGSGNKLLAKAIVINGSVTDFYSNFNNYVNYAKEIGSTFNAPDLKNFAVVEEFKNNSGLSNVAKDDKILRATFQDTETGKNGEGLFMATIVDTGSNTATLGYDVLFYAAYNVMGISTGEYDLINYQDILTESLNSLVYKDSFVNATIKNGQEQTKNTLALNASIQQAYDSYNNAWSVRQKTYDISSQKYSDATLGYERVYDTETGSIYKAYNGFTDDYTGSRYQPITDDMYTESITGYIEK